MENPESETVFAKIIRREIPAQIIYEDDLTIAFLDAYPNNPGHTLVVPKKWSRNILSMDEETWLAVAKTIKKVAPAVKEATNAEGLNINMNVESAGNQAVFHTHVHIIPRYANDGFKPFAPGSYAPGEMEAVANKIRPLLNHNL